MSEYVRKLLLYKRYIDFLIEKELTRNETRKTNQKEARRAGLDEVTAPDCACGFQDKP